MSSECCLHHRPSNRVMGATGTGKSTFINLVSGGDFATGEGLFSCTNQVSSSNPFEIAGRRVVLIDTPGFDDSTLSDTKVLQMIALYLSMTYKEGFKLSGLIYMHRITDFKVGGVSQRNFRMFRELCGEDALRNVLIVTTMWGLVQREKGEAREQELISARMVRHYNNMQTAQNIIFMMLNNRPMALQIQKEIIDEKKDISETAAGVELDQELAALARKHREELASIQRDMEQALKEKDEEIRKELEEYHKEVQSNMDSINKDRERLSKEFSEEKARGEKIFQEMHVKLEAQKKARQDGEKALKETMAKSKKESRLHAQETAQLRQQIQRQEKEQRRTNLLGKVLQIAVGSQSSPSCRPMVDISDSDLA
ncbi:P-loop containing nucleoside triphosphate hydrolase protein [Abortiporus biennis]|nr:P-loop containing nucleoside triphosphate hydrolase protein [Abortiporus biennis]